jgi:hypothetical protein
MLAVTDDIIVFEEVIAHTSLVEQDFGPCGILLFRANLRNSQTGIQHLETG